MFRTRLIETVGFLEENCAEGGFHQLKNSISEVKLKKMRPHHSGKRIERFASKTPSARKKANIVRAGGR